MKIKDMDFIHLNFSDLVELLTLQQWSILLALLVVVILVSRLAAGLLQRAISAVFSRITFQEYSKKDVQALSLLRPIQCSISGWGVVLGLMFFGIGDPVLSVVLGIAKLLTYFGFVWGGLRLSDLVLIFLSEKAAATETKFDDLLAPLISRTLKVVVITMGFLSIAEILKLPLASLITGLGIGGLAVAMAAKDTIANVFGSLSIIADRPFNIGDWVKINEVEGTVEQLGFRSTRIRTFYNSLISIPNGTLLTAVVDNMGERAFRRYKTNIGLVYSTPPEKIESFTQGIRDIIKSNPKMGHDNFHVYLNDFSDSSLDILLYCFFKVADWGEELAARQELMLSIIKLAQSLEIEFAFPSRSLYIERSSEQSIQ